ncbi:MAG: cob(I)yrinic acid a,c-diamide adenosyltransferase, partial [Flavobacteriaceae bacterium]
VDELNSWIGMLRDQDLEKSDVEMLMSIQNNLFTLGAMLATDPNKAVLKSGKERLDIPLIHEEDIRKLEQAIDLMNEVLPPMTHFILPGGHQIVSSCHIARTVCRRAERMTSLLNENEPLDKVILTYLNRLSDFLFVLARKLSSQFKVEEVKWIPSKKV